MAEKGKAKENLLFRIKIFALPRYWAEQERNSEKNEIVLAYVNENVNKRMTKVLLKLWKNSKATLVVVPEIQTATVPPQEQIEKMNQQNQLQKGMFCFYLRMNE